MLILFYFVFVGFLVGNVLFFVFLGYSVGCALFFVFVGYSVCCFIFCFLGYLIGRVLFLLFLWDILLIVFYHCVAMIRSPARLMHGDNFY